MTENKPNLSRIPAEQLDGQMTDILVNFDMLTISNLPESEGKKRLDRDVEKEDTNYHDDWREIRANPLITFEDGTWLEVGGRRTDVDGVYDPVAPNASYQITFVHNSGPKEEPRPKNAFSVEKYADRPGMEQPWLTVWDMQDPGSAEYFSGERIEGRPELNIIQEVQDKLVRETDAHRDLHTG